MSKYKVASPEEIQEQVSEAKEAFVGRRIEAIVSEYIAPAIRKGDNVVWVDVNKDRRMEDLIEHLGEQEVMTRFAEAGYGVTISWEGQVFPGERMEHKIKFDW